MSAKIDYENKKVLLIGGGGTIGTYVAKELIEKGCSVDIICLEDYTSDNERLRYFKANVTKDFLRGFLLDKYYNGILDLVHHDVPEDYIDYHMLIAPKTDHEIFFSSIRAIGNAQHPITEEAPLILDLIDEGTFTDKEFIERDAYALTKARYERYLRRVSKFKNWTIIRPMINSSEKRLDLILNTFQSLVELSKAGETIYQPDICRNVVAGLEWAGNTGKMIANLLFKEECMGETYMLSTGHRMTWEDVADVYTELLGAKIAWVPVEEYTARTGHGGFPLKYDRNYDRAVDNTKILKATGLTKEDFVPFKEGIRIELEKLGAI